MFIVFRDGDTTYTSNSRELIPDHQAAWTTDDIIPMLCSVMAAATTYVPNWAANLVFCSEVPDSLRHTLSYPARLDFA